MLTKPAAPSLNEAGTYRLKIVATDDVTNNVTPFHSPEFTVTARHRRTTDRR